MENFSPVPEPRPKGGSSLKILLKRIIRVIVVTCIVLVVLIRTVAYGAPWRSCEYTVSNDPMPDAYKNRQFIVNTSAYTEEGKDRDYACLSISNFNLNWENSGGWSSAELQDYYRDTDRIYKPVASSTVFHIVKFIKVTKHGIGTIDSGPGPLPVAILADEQGNTYMILSGDLGFTDHGGPFSYLTK
jgi:hypothetical protein